MKSSYSLYNNLWLEDNYHLEVINYYYRNWKQFNMEFHNHDEIEIMYVIKGKCTIMTEKQKYLLKKGDFILIDANIPHALIVDEEETCRMLNIEFIFKKSMSNYLAFGELVAQVKSVNTMLKMKKSHIQLKDTGEVYNDLHKVINELNQNSENLMIQIQLMQLMIDISRQLVQFTDENISNKNIYVKKAIEYLYHHYDCDVKVSDIAGSINIHEGYLYRIFKQSTGKTLMNYLMEIRLDKAKIMLENTDISITDIAEYIGINSRQYFTYLYKQYYRVTPSNYRNNFSASKKKKRV
ncbi:AraC family transcriptional regulator [Vallitalea sediminicola]